MGWLEKLDGARDGLIRKVRWSQGWVGQKSQMELGMGWLEKLNGARMGQVHLQPTHLWTKGKVQFNYEPSIRKLNKVYSLLRNFEKNIAIKNIALHRKIQYCNTKYCAKQVNNTVFKNI